MKIELMKRLASVSLLVLAGMSASTASAQSASASANPIELGIDAGIGRTLGSDGVTMVSIPNGEFRVGFFVSNRLSIEPRINVVSVSGSGSTYTEYGGDVGILYHVSNNRVGIGPYVRPFVGLTGESGGGSYTQAEAGVGVGTKIPIADRLAVRLEGAYNHEFSSGQYGSANELAVLFGLSFFTH